GELGDRAAESIQSREQGGEVADGVGLRDVLAQRLQCAGDAARGRTAPHSLLEESHLALEFDEFALEVGERLLRRRVGVLPDRALALSGANVDGARLIDPTPRSLTLYHWRLTL